MAQDTKIQWCDDTVNPSMGCDGCELWNPSNGVKRCYAGVLHERYGGQNPGFAPTFEDVTLYPGRMAKAAASASLLGRKRPTKPWLNGCRRMIFASDMSDALSKVVSFDFLMSEIIEHVRSPAGRRHVWLWLTKQPGRMAKFSRWLASQGVAWPKNVWPGTSITGKASLARIGHLVKVGDETTTRFLSVEPQWEDVRLRNRLQGIAWIIQGGESGPQAETFRLSWARRLRDDCDAKGIAYFLKQLGCKPVDGRQPLTLRDGHGGDWGEWPDDLRVRQVPEAARQRS